MASVHAALLRSEEARSDTGPRRAPTIDIADGLLTAQIEGRRLDWVLDEISRSARIAVIGQVGGETIDARFDAVPLGEALRSLLGSYDTFVFHSGPTARAVWIYAKGQGRGLEPVPPEMWASTREIRAGLTDPDPATRAASYEALIERSEGQTRDVVDLLEAALADDSVEVRTRALYTALSAGAAVPVDTLSRLALDDESEDVRFLALEGLTGAAEVDVVARAVLNEDPSPTLRRVALRMLDRRAQTAMRPAR